MHLQQHVNTGTTARQTRRLSPSSGSDSSGKLNENFHYVMSDSNSEMRATAARICRDYLHGVWKHVNADNIVFKHISGGLSNWVYNVQLPEGTTPLRGEPRQVLLRIYGQTHGERAMESIITESVIFTLLSERKLGPKLHGVFPGGRIEEYIPARPLLTKELADPELSAMTAEKMALLHMMQVPINKEPTWLWDTMAKWRTSAEEVLKNVEEVDTHLMKHIEYGNILLRQNTRKRELVIIDFEYCSYNYRGFDLANHFVEWQYDYTAEEYPFFHERKGAGPTDEQKYRWEKATARLTHNYCQSSHINSRHNPVLMTGTQPLGPAVNLHFFNTRDYAVCRWTSYQHLKEKISASINNESQPQCGIKRKEDHTD
ncbi:Similar to Chkb: Choline/ethanolamine kinase (Rattus norvegicus) [Cotesia congregata]|uniref:Similar to Chkb: Choline/ethanolamine kinase (Rattus norvegicus) n=1 Tax=Cotesia congregata TaxID=51543 RepID=A0A8J2HQV4_COTCN|nr:Similar to Chkb: Choline/ethanolamine kinase (Rattus norvegicus) [Cotesia congregata]